MFLWGFSRGLGFEEQYELICNPFGSDSRFCVGFFTRAWDLRKSMN